jgi:Putative Flp pilus-assembly TadE/G-like
MTWGEGVAREDGQILPALVMLLVAILAVAVMGFQVGRAAILRSEAQTAADAAALAGAREIRRQLQLQWATFHTTDIGAVDQGLVRARMAEYAELNGGRLVKYEPNGVDVRVWVDTEEKLGEEARVVDSEDERGAARARATLSLGASGVGAGGGIDVPAVGSGEIPDITDKEWKDVGERIGKPPLSCPEDVITLGLFLKSQGFHVWQNNHPELGGDAGHLYNPSSWHLKCGGMGALDVNFNANEGPALDSIRGPVERLGFFTIWRAEDHYDHMHIDPSTSAIGGTGGFAGPLDDVLLSVRLVDWDAELAPFALFGQYGSGGNYGGPPDLQIVRLICEMSEPYGPKIRLAAFEAAIVESGIHNLQVAVDYDSLGVFQQRPSVGEWGTAEQILDPVHATMMFLRTARAMDDGESAGELAAQVQRPREDLRGRYAAVEGQARALIEKHCFANEIKTTD